MRSIFSGHFRPIAKDFATLWSKAIVCVDANVVLNLYRYSDNTREALENVLTSYKDRLFIPHQAAKEFLKNRLIVTASQAKEYENAIVSLEKLASNLSQKNQHPFLPDSEQEEFLSYSKKLTGVLSKRSNELHDKLTNDELLTFVEKTFEGRTGKPFSKETIAKIYEEGSIRYAEEIPPGYKDSNKAKSNDPDSQFGDLLVWKQIIDFSKTSKKPIIFVTDDKKEDWWLKQSGKTIGPHPSLVQEFHHETGKLFWMYTVERFIQEVAQQSKTEVDPAVLEEVIKVSSLENQPKESFSESRIEVSQEVLISSETFQKGKFHITLKEPMRYASGAAKFSPFISSPPDILIKMTSCPQNDESRVKLSTGCGTLRNFHIHMKGVGAKLEVGTYSFEYEAMTGDHVETLENI